MDEFIASRIEQAANRSLDQGRAKYFLYFPNHQARYEKWRPLVDKILIVKGYKGVIPVENNENE